MSGRKRTYSDYLFEETEVEGASGTSAPTPTTPPTTVVGATDASTTNTPGTGTNAYQKGVGIESSVYDSAAGTADKNYQLGKSYAEGVRDSAYNSAEAATAEANRLANNLYQRSVIDSSSSYQKAIGAYGSNAETLASRGLSGSGYGEWLQGNAYATHRGEVQNAGAQRLATQKEAAYKEQQAKAVADAAYGQFLYQNEVDYNNKMQAIEEAKASDAAAKVEASFTTALDLLSKGWTMSEVQNYLGADAWAALGDKTGQLTAASEAYNRIKAETEGKTAQESLLSYLELAATGAYTIEALEAIAKSMGHYDVLSAADENGASLWSQVTSTVNGINNKQTVQDMINNGATKEEIESSDAYAGLTPGDKASADSLITERDEGIKETEKNEQLTIEAAIEEAKDYTSLEELNSYLVREMVPESKRSAIIAGWQKRNTDDSIKDLQNAKFENGQLIIDGEPMTAENVYAGVKSGVFGDNGNKVITAYVNAVLKTAGSSGATLADAVWAREQFSSLAQAMHEDGRPDSEIWNLIPSNKIENVFIIRNSDVKEDWHTGNETIEGVKCRNFGEVQNKYTLQKLNDLYSGTSSAFVYLEGIYYRYDAVTNMWLKYKLL